MALLCTFHELHSGHLGFDHFRSCEQNSTQVFFNHYHIVMQNQVETHF